MEARASGAARMSGLLHLAIQARHVDDVAEAHVLLLHALVGVVDFLNRDDLDFGSDAVLGAEVEHVLRLSDRADQQPAKGGGA